MSDASLPTSTPRYGDGTSLELAIASTVAIAIAMHYCEPIDSFFVAGHEHEGLRKDAVSVAWEGGPFEWTNDWPETDRAKSVAAELGVWFEAINGCILGVFPKD